MSATIISENTIVSNAATIIPENTIPEAEDKPELSICPDTLAIRAADGSIVCPPPHKFEELNYSEVNLDDLRFPLVVEELIDGPSIRIFYDSTTSHWRLATRKRLGLRHGWTTPGKSFEEIFFDLTGADEKDCEATPLVRQLERFRLSKGVVVGWFVMVSPDARNFMPVGGRRFHLLGLYNLENQMIAPGPDTHWGVSEPTRFAVARGDFENMFRYEKTAIAGVRLRHNETITHIYTPRYQYLKNLRGNQPKIAFRVLEILANAGTDASAPTLTEFANEFREFASEVSATVQRLNILIDYTCRSYVRCYLAKTLNRKAAMEALEPPMRKLCYEALCFFKRQNGGIAPKYVQYGDINRFLKSLEVPLVYSHINRITPNHK
jgi:hypothetical protein